MQSLLELLKKGEAFLKKKGIEKPQIEAQLIFAHVLKISRIELFLQQDKPLTQTEILALRQALLERSLGKPLAYIFSEKWFYGRPFFVSPAVLIPRPETEELVELVLKQNLTGKYLHDLGSGSGCIGITLALEANLAGIDFSDISEAALAITQKNFHNLTATLPVKPPARFFQADLLNSVKEELTGFYDLVVSNPPYVLPEEYEQLDFTVRGYEPKIALIVPNSETFFRTMFLRCHQVLKKEGMLFLETSPSVIDLQHKLLEETGFSHIQKYLDLAGKSRFLVGIKA